MAEARTRGLVVGAWGVETEEDVVRAVTCGLSGFAHNYPDRAQEQMGRVVREAM